jgi:osmotically-inducible protein OsmY
MRPDNEIAVSVANVLRWHVAVDHERINICVKDGVVTLEGTVDWDFQRQDVENMIRCLPDVRRLDNLLGIRPAAPAPWLQE